MTTTADPAGTDPAVTLLEQSLWHQLGEGAQIEQFLAAWLELQVRIAGQVQAAVLVMKDTESGSFVPAAQWPPGRPADQALSEVIEHALNEQRGVVRRMPDGAVFIAFPVTVDDAPFAAVALRSDPRDDTGMRLLMRQLQWGTGWIELLARRRAVLRLRQTQKEATAAVDVVVNMLETRGHKAAAMSVATSVAHILRCDRVSVGLLHRRGVKVVAMSHAAEFSQSLYLSDHVRRAMIEAVDQAAIILRSTQSDQAQDEQVWVTRAHAELIRANKVMAVLTVPLRQGDRVIGAMTFEHREAQGFGPHQQDMAVALAAVVGPLIAQKRKADRGILWRIGAALWRGLRSIFGPAYLGRKLGLVVALAAGVFLYGARADFEVPAQARLEGAVQRIISAPFDGYLVEQIARPGDAVAAGDVLARMEDRDIVQQLLNAESELGERQIELNSAIAEGARTRQALLEAQIKQAQAQVTLMQQQLERTALRAPFAGIVVAGDKSQELGAAVSRGEELYVVALLDGYRVMLDVDERDIAALEVGQSGAVRFASHPETPVAFDVTRILPVSDVVDGVNRFRVEARLRQPAAEAGLPLLPGMEGVGRVSIGTRSLLWVWTHRAYDWAQLSLWRWVP